jgi:hypothetical protein
MISAARHQKEKSFAARLNPDQSKMAKIQFRILPFHGLAAR